jgi:phosphoglycerate kinase
MDIGPETLRQFSDVIAGAGTILWNGPLGVFERPEYSAGTHAIAEALVAATSRGAVTVIGGGDTVAAIESMGLSDGVTHVSTGGGASMEYLEGRSMPSIDVLG